MAFRDPRDNAITEAAVAQLEKLYPHMKIVESGGWDSMYHIRVNFPSLPRDDEGFILHEGTDVESIVAEVVKRITAVRDEAAKKYQDILADTSGAA